jgi:hypothetical protein
MKRPAAVTASAVVAIVGSLLLLMMAGLALVASYGPLPPTPGTPAVVDPARLIRAGALALGAFAVLGLTTATGLLRLRPWARISTLVFAGVMAFTCLAAGVSIAALPMPPAAIDPGAARLLRPTLAVVYGIPFLIGVWWLVQFNRPSTREAFAGAAEPAAPGGRPLSITIIGWWLVVGGAATIIPALSALPAMLFGAILTGWTARLTYVVFAALQISAGTGVLRRQDPARLLAIGWFLLGIANLLLMVWLPGTAQRLDTYQRMLGTPLAGTPAFDMVPFMQRTMPVWAICFAVPIWFLVRRRAAFQGDAGG